MCPSALTVEIPAFLGGGELDSAMALSLRSEEAVFSFPRLQNQRSSSHVFKS